MIRVAAYGLAFVLGTFFGAGLAAVDLIVRGMP